MKNIKLLLLLIIIFFSFCLKCNALDIPRLYIDGSLSDMKNKDIERKVFVKYVSSDISFDSYAKLKVQGASSTRYEKKNYNITFYKDDSYDEKKEIDFKWGGMSKYTLKANWIDKSQSRNNVTANIYADIQKRYGLFIDSPNYGVVDGFPIEVYLNDKFYGIYTLNLHKDYFFYNSDNLLVIAGKASSVVTNFKQEAKDDWISFEVEIGEQNNTTLEQLNRLITFVIESSDEEFVEHFEEYFNLDAMLNYYCYLMFAELVDNGNNNLFLVTYDGLIWYPSMYDLDISWGTSRVGNLIPYDENMHFLRKGSKLWEKFEKNYSDYIAVRYLELRENILTKENVMNEFNKFYGMIPEDTFIKEQKKWKDIPGYDLSQIESFLEVRIPFVDREIENMKTDNYENVYNEFYYKNRGTSNSFQEELEMSSVIIWLFVLIIILFFSCTFSKKYD